MNSIIEILIGLILLVVPIFLWIIDWLNFGTAALMFLQGALIWIFIFIGLLLIALGISDLRG